MFNVQSKFKSERVLKKLDPIIVHWQAKGSLKEKIDNYHIQYFSSSDLLKVKYFFNAFQNGGVPDLK